MLRRLFGPSRQEIWRRSGDVTIIYTRMRAPYVNPGGFRFTLDRAGLFSGVARWLGMQDVEVAGTDLLTATIVTIYVVTTYGHDAT